MNTSRQSPTCVMQSSHSDKKQRSSPEPPALDPSNSESSSVAPRTCPLFIQPDVWKRIYYHAVTRKAVAYLKENVAGPICLPHASAAACMETTSFARAFRRHSGMTFMKFAKAYRISVFVARLEVSDDPITVLAQECGFNSLVTLERAFRQFVGQTPSGYRSQFLASQLPLPGKAPNDRTVSARS